MGIVFPVTTLPVDVTVGTGPILEKMKLLKQAWSDPFLPRMKEKIGSEQLWRVAQSVRGEGC